MSFIRLFEASEQTLETTIVSDSMDVALYKFTLTENYDPDLVYFCQRGEKSNEWKIYGITTDKNFPLIRF